MQHLKLLVASLVAAVAVAGVGCVSDAGSEDGNTQTSRDASLGDASSPAIQSFEIEPETLAQNSSGMTDRHFTVTIETSGFPNGVDEVALSIRDPERTAPKNSERTMSVDGGTVTIERIQATWFSSLDAGDYDIGATVQGPQGRSVSRWGLATVTLTE
jgi:hypothetical protein